jgi:outer membrane protein TolC
MKKIMLMIVLVAVSAVVPVYSQQAGAVTLEECRSRALASHPMRRQYSAIGISEQIDLALLRMGWLPRVSISAGASLQSDVLPLQERDQYRLSGEISQMIWDGGRSAARRSALEAGALVEKNRLDVDLYQLNQQIDRLYFGILLMERQREQTELLRKELELNRERVSAFIRNGVAYQSDLDAIGVELLNVRQREIELRADRKSFISMLSALTGKELSAETRFQVPAGDEEALFSGENRRPELDLFESRRRAIELQRKVLVSENLPRISAFLQAGYGRPGLNMLDPDFDTFYITGVQVHWELSSLYGYRRNLEDLENEIEKVNAGEESFRLDTRTGVLQGMEEIEKIRQLLKTDDEIIRRREQMKQAAEIQLENGTISINDLIREINAENRAVQQRAVHEVQLLMAIYTLKNISNN